MLSKIKTFFELPISDKLVLIKISLLVPLIEIGIKTIKFKKTFNILNLFVSKNTKPIKNELIEINRHVNLLYLFQRQFPFLGKCLSRSLGIWFLLAKKGINTQLKFGMKKENNELLAHSWLEYNGKMLDIENEKNKKYTPFSESILTEVSKYNII